MHLDRLCLGLIGLAALFITACGTPGTTEPMEEMRAPHYENTPSAIHMDQAQRAYERGLYLAAMEQYRIAAQWGDKFGQYNIGVMYLRGEGVDFDPVRGWAWLELAAERDYPQFVEPADELYAMLDEEQRQLGRAILEEELMPEYGDDVAVERAARRMERERRNMTGTRTGSLGMAAMLTVIDDSGTHMGHEYYSEERWDYEQIIEAEQQFMTHWAQGRIDLQPMELIDDEDEDESDGSSQTQD